MSLKKMAFPINFRQTSDIPPNLTNPNGKILLGHLGPDGGENLQIGKPIYFMDKINIFFQLGGEKN